VPFVVIVVSAANVHLQPNHHKELMEEVKAAAGHVAVVRELNSVSDAAGAGDGAEDAAVNPLVGQLHHVETVDKSKPVIDATTHVQKVRHTQQLQPRFLGHLQGMGHPAHAATSYGAHTADYVCEYN
jgi:hypothetical protein